VRSVIACTRGFRRATFALQIFAWLNLLWLGIAIALDLFFPVDYERAPLAFLVRHAFFFCALPMLLAEALLFSRRGRCERNDRLFRLKLAGRETEFTIESVEFLRRPRWVRLKPLKLDLYPWSIVEGAPKLVSTTVRVLQFLVVPLILILLLFNLHQQIAFGGFLGQWYLESPSRWLYTLSGVSLTVYIDLFCWAAWLQLPVELLCLLKLPRRPLQMGAAMLYTLGIAALILLRLGS
jgi:hypothetical protein